jgi:VanZ family protein
MVGWWGRLPAALRMCLPLAVMLLLWWSSSRQPTEQEPSQLRAVLHNGMHVVAYAALAGSWLLALVRTGDSPSRLARAVLASFLLAVAYGAVDELHQSFVPGRVCSIADLVTDAAGSVLALLVLRSLLGAGRLAWRQIVLTLVICLGCVAFATWGPW